MTEPPAVLIVEDQPAVAKSLQVLFGVYELPARVVTSADEAERVVQAERVGAVVQDMNLAAGRTDGRDGIALFRRLRRLRPGLPVILITAWTSLETAVSLVKEGAVDYMAKPWDDQKLVARVRRALEEQARTDAAEGQALDHAGLICESPAMAEVVRLGLRVADSNAPLLITGPNGAGKEKLADLIVARSSRADRPYVKVNAGGLPEGLVEAELFGAERGAFTGSDKRRIGRFEAADGGTLLLDEIGNLAEAGQRRLLRVLQSGAFERLGSSVTREVDVRILAATNEDLGEAVREGRFREDLLFRLNVIELAIPPLKDRPEDILPLAERFVRAQAVQSGVEPKRLSPAARAALLAHPWPGNVRELDNRIRRALLVGQGTELAPMDLGIAGGPGPAGSGVDDPRAADDPGGAGALGDQGRVGAPSPREIQLSAAEQDERARIAAALHEAKGVVADAARSLGLSRQALYRRMRRLGVAVERVVD